MNFFLRLRMSSSSECMETILELFEITFSISFSSFTKRFPVEEPANSFTPQHPSRFLILSNPLYYVVWRQNKKHNYKTFYFWLS